MLEAIVLGIVQGLTEFLPVSSSAHLILLPALFGWGNPEEKLAFDVALHFGTTLAVIAYFRADLIGMAVGLLRLASGGGAPSERAAGRLALLVCVSMVPAGVAGILWKDAIEGALRNDFRVIAAMLVLLGVALFLVDRRRGLSREVESVRLPDALLLGVAQALALVPGVSRSGATMTVALLLGLTREAAARFSFLMATPVVLGAALLAAKDLWKAGLPAGEAAPMAAGVAASAVAGFLCIRFFLAFLKTRGFAPFAIYRIAFGIALLSWFSRAAS